MRLAEKVDAAAWVTRYLTPNLGNATTLLDVGCGPGVLASAAGRAHPSLQVTGVDLHAKRFEALSNTPSNVTLQTGDACALLLKSESNDFVYCRFLLQYLAKRQEAISEMVCVCRPGGRVMLQDLDGQLLWHYPEDVDLQQQLGLVLEGLSKTGFDPFVGRKLFSMLKCAGLKDVEVSVESYHLYAGAIDGHNNTLWGKKFDIAMPVAAKILGGDLAARNLKTRFLEYLRRDDTLTYSVVFTVIGTKPEINPAK